MFEKRLLFLIIILAALLRLWNLSDNPPGLTWDEASLGYNAYSLLQTGKDEYGNSWPLTLKSFGDYKPALYAYTIMPFVAILGLNEWAVRLPSAMFGIATVVLIYFLAKEIFLKREIGLTSAFLLAISPWHLHFSRGGWETNTATFFIVLGVYLFIKSIKDTRYLFWSFISFLISMYTYQSPRLIVPLLGLTLLAFYYKKIIKSYQYKDIKKTHIGAALVLIILSIPLILQFTSGAGSARFTGLSYLSDIGPINRTNELRGEHYVSDNPPAKIFHNRVTSLIPEFLGHYLDHFRPDFLFIRGDPLMRNKVPETGQFYLIEALFLIVGMFVLIRQKYRHTLVLVAWILISPLASSLTYQTPHALRALSMVIPLTLVMGYGLWVVVTFLRSKFKIVGILLISGIIIFEAVHYLESYYVHYPKRYPLAWEYGFSQMIRNLSKIEGNYKKIVITDRYDQPYILLLFFIKYDPKKYQPQANLSERDKFNFGTIRNFDNYEFRSIVKTDIKDASHEILFIGTAEEIPNDAKILDEVHFMNNEPAFIFTEGEKK